MKREARTARPEETASGPGGGPKPGGSQAPGIRPAEPGTERQAGAGCRQAYHVGEGDAGVGSLHSEEHLVPVVQKVVDFGAVAQQRVVPGFRHQPEVVPSSGDNKELPHVPGPAGHDSGEEDRGGRVARAKDGESGREERERRRRRPSRELARGLQGFAVARGSRYGDGALARTRRRYRLGHAHAQLSGRSTISALLSCAPPSSIAGDSGKCGSGGEVLV